MKVQELVDSFNSAMQDIRYGYWTHEGTNASRAIFAEGVMQMEKLYEPLWEILKQHKDDK